MSIQLHEAVSNILNMPYFKNDNARSGTYNLGHEEAVAVKIKDAGFVEVQKSLYPKLSKSILTRWGETNNDSELRTVTPGLSPGTVILQPAGSQAFPDILIKDFSDRFVAIECKSGKKGLTPMWNDNIPKSNTIYVLSSGQYNKTTIFMSQDVISVEEQTLMDEQEELISKIVDLYNTKIKSIDKFNRGWIQKSRKQHFQGGKKDKTNYFTHSDRRTCEENTMAYALL
jgi:hypothetical protein